MGGSGSQMGQLHNTVFSPDRRYRYWLEAKLSDADGICMFLMLNPSTADEMKSDPTVTRAKGFARSWGYGTLWVCNIFALRATQPAVLRKDPEPVGAENDEHILIRALQSDELICAWGNHGVHLDRGSKVLDMLETQAPDVRLGHLGMTMRNQPKHPLYLRADTPLSYFSELN